MKIDYWQTLHEKAFYHVYNRTNGDALLFANQENHSYFMRQWHKYLGNYVDTIAYCLMSNHFHFVVRVKCVDEYFIACVQNENTTAAQAFLQHKISVNGFLEDQFKRFFSSYAKSFNKQQSRHGSLFEPSFKRVQLISHAHLMAKIAYVHHNPLHHKASKTYGAWVYSSYNTYLSDKPTRVKRTDGLRLFHPDTGVESFIVYHDEYHKRWLSHRPDLYFNDEMDTPEP